MRRIASSCTRTYSANAPSLCTDMPGVLRPEHSDGRPARQNSHSPQRGVGPPTTSSPTFQRSTFGPVAMTRPENS